MANEHKLMNDIRAELSRLGWCVFRANVGKVYMKDGRFFDTGLPKGFSDLFAVKDGRIVFLECKVHPNKPSSEQIQFLETMKARYGCDGSVVYSVDEAKGVCNEAYKD